MAAAPPRSAATPARRRRRWRRCRAIAEGERARRATPSPPSGEASPDARQQPAARTPPSVELPPVPRAPRPLAAPLRTVEESEPTQSPVAIGLAARSERKTGRRPEIPAT